MTLPSLNAIRVFEATARLGSLKEAADELSLTSSAVSRHISTLENAVGTKLFVRGFRQVTLTMRGIYYAQRLAEAFRIIEDATEEVSVNLSVRPHKTKCVTLSSESTFMNLWLADRLPLFRKLHPDMDLEVSIIRNHEDPKVDLCIVFAFDEKADQSLKQLIALKVTPVCSPALLNGSIPLRTPADLANHRLLHESTVTWWERWVQQEGLSGMNVKSGAFFHDPTLVIREAVNGGGVALADTIMCEDLLKKGLLVAPFSVRHSVAAGYYIRQRPGVSGKPEARLLREWLFDEIKKHKHEMQLA